MNEAIEIGKRIKQRREELNITQEYLGKCLCLNKSTIQRYETGKVKTIKLPVIQSIATQLHVDPNWLVLKTDNPNIKVNNNLYFPSPNITEEHTTFPVIGDIAAGYNHIATESWEGDTVEIPDSYLFGHKKEDFFVLRVVGDSMYPLYHENDKVLILKQSTLNMSGEIGAVLYDDEIVTLKKVEYVIGEDWLRLVPINPNYKPETIEDERLEHCKIIGIPRLLLREL